MLPMAVSALVWFLVHRLGPQTMRPVLVARLSENGFRGIFTLFSLAAMTGMVLAYRAAPYVALWDSHPWGAPLATVLVGLGFILVAFGVTNTNPTAGEASTLVQDHQLPVRGMTRITRHPVMMGMILWASAHILANGHLAAVLLFGSLLLTAATGMASLDQKTRARVGDDVWERFAAQTSRLPFAAILRGRTTLALGEVSPVRLGVGIALFVAAFLAHQSVIGIPALPY